MEATESRVEIAWKKPWAWLRKPSLTDLYSAALAILFLGPLVVLFSQLRLEWIREIAGSASFLRSLKDTLISGLGGALFSLGVGTFFARRFAFYEWRGKRLYRLLLLIPYLVPNFILASAYVIAWNPATGALNRWLRFPNGLYGLGGMVLIFGVAHTPVAFLLLEEKFRRIDGPLREAARISGAQSRDVLRKIELPLLLPSFASALSLCFSLNISAFAIPAWIGVPAKAYPLTYKIYQTLQLGGDESLPKAAAFSFILFALAVPLLLLGQWFKRQEKKFIVLSGKSSRSAGSMDSRTHAVAFHTVFWTAQILFWMAPLACLALSTVTPPGGINRCFASGIAECLSSWNLQSYRYVLFDLAETRAALHGSLVYGSISAFLIVFISVLTLVLFSGERRKTTGIEWIFSIPVATPGAIIALALIVAYSGRFGVNLYNTPLILVMAFILKHLSLAFQPLRNGMSTISESLVEAARLSGARPGRIWRKILLPLLKPEFLGGFFLVLIPILGELTMSVFLASPTFRSIGTVLFDLQDYADQASAGALSILLILGVLSLNEVARFLSKGKLGY